MADTMDTKVTTEELKAKLSNLTQRTQAVNNAAEATAKPAAPTATKSKAKELSPDKIARATATSNVAATLGHLQETIPEGKKYLFEAMAKHTYIAGYITNYNEKTDFAAKKIGEADTNKVTYDIHLRMAAPSTVQGVIIMEPAELKAYFEDKQYEVPANVKAILSLRDLPFGSPEIKYVAKILPWNEVAKYMLDYTNGKLKEHPALVEAYTKGGKKPVSFAAGDDSSEIFATIRMPAKGKSEKGVKVQVKHKYRSRIVTPHNYVALKRYKTDAIKTTYTDDEAKTKIAVYLSRFTKPAKNQDVSPVQALNPACARYFTTENSAVVKSAYFATEGETSWANSNEGTGVDHWYNKDANGVPEKIAGPNVQLVHKERVSSTNKSGETVLRTVTGYDELGSATSGSAYRFDEATYGTIIDLTKGCVTREMLSVKKQPVIKLNGGKTINKVSSIFSGSALAGLSIADIEETIKKNAI